MKKYVDYTYKEAVLEIIKGAETLEDKRQLAHYFRMVLDQEPKCDG